MCVIKQPNSVGASVRCSKVCKHSSEFFTPNKPMGSQLAKQELLQNVNSVVNHPHIVQGQPQRKDVSQAIVRCQSLKYVNNVSCVDQLCSVKLAPNVGDVAQNLPDCTSFGKLVKPWGPDLSSTNVKEGYTLPFQIS